jgi:hypothetical protein
MEMRKMIDSKAEGVRKDEVLAELSNNREGRMTSADLDHIRCISSEFSLYLKSDTRLPGYDSRVGCISVNGMYFKVRESTVITPSMFPMVFVLYDYERISAADFKKLSKMVRSAAPYDRRVLIEVKENGAIKEIAYQLKQIRR